MTQPARDRGDVFALRGAVDDARLARDTLHAEADHQWVSARGWRARLARWDNGGGVFAPGLTRENVAAQERTQAELRTRLTELDTSLLAAMGVLRARLTNADPLFTDDDVVGGATTVSGRAMPVALLPVRLETVFTSSTELCVRVYPDDLAVEALDRTLTAAEQQAAERYWNDPTDQAWEVLLAQLSPARASWAAWATRPGGGPAQQRVQDPPPGPRTSCLPDRWRFVGVTDDVTVVDVTGSSIPRPLSLDLTVSDGAWLLDFDQAVAVGMAARLTLPADVDHLDQLFAIGVSSESPSVAAGRLQALIESHLFTDGFGFLPAGTPTNNTPASRSAWSSAPRPPRTSSPPPEAPAGSAADLLTRALGLDGAAATRLADHADEDDQRAVRAMSRLTWGAFRQGLLTGASTVKNDFLPVTYDSEKLPAALWWRLGQHVADHVHSRGTLPTLRLGRQPYGMLPVTSLDEWESDGVNPHPYPGLHARELLGLAVLPASEAVSWCERLVAVYRTRLALSPSEPIAHSDVGYALHVLAERLHRGRDDLLAGADGPAWSEAAFDEALHAAAAESVAEYLTGYERDKALVTLVPAHVPLVSAFLPDAERQAALDRLAAITAAHERDTP